MKMRLPGRTFAGGPAKALRSYQPGSNQWRTLSRAATLGTSHGEAPITGAAEAETESARQYCSDLVRNYDRPSFTLSTFIPRQAQTLYLALRALNISLSMIPEMTSSYTIGLMRLQFWRDTINKTLAGRPPKEPVALLLNAGISDLHDRTQGRARLSKGWFLRMINAREQTISNAPFTNLSALESYAENTYSTLLYLTISALPMTSLTVDHVASHIGKAAGISAVLRGLPLVAFPQQQPKQPTSPLGGGAQGAGTKQGAITLPLDVMAQSGVKEEDVFRYGAEASGLKDAVFTIATRASDHLITARQMIKNLRAGQGVGHNFEHEGEEGHHYGPHNGELDTEQQPHQSPHEKQLREVERAFGVLMPAVPTQLWLDRLQKVDFDIFNPTLLQSDWRLPWKAYWAYRRKEF